VKLAVFGVKPHMRTHISGGTWIIIWVQFSEKGEDCQQQQYKVNDSENTAPDREYSGYLGMYLI